ncbi:lipase family protein [Nocardia xishanensis]|uniref:lipase family protein n=1 Tax=Nocardia xishanensis TaxID=238964 RepID=UPI0008299161|nr:lipase family protein [Nocardia xishanensis]
MTNPLEPTASEVDDFFLGGQIGFDPHPGDILRRRSIELADLDEAGRAFQLVYATRAGFSAPIPASGTVIAPATTELTGPGPILVYCPSFHGLGGGCAPSQLLADGSEPEAVFISAALARGWTVAVPDGLGLGMTRLGPHQFLAGRAAAHAVLDFARAVRVLPELDAVDAPLVVWGYADGGRAAVWAAEQHLIYAPDLDLRGVAAGAVVADPGALVLGLDGGAWAGLALAGLIGLGRAYAHLPVAHILTDDGEQAVAAASDMNLTALLATYRDVPLGRWCERPDPWSDPIWRYVLANETSARETPVVPVHLYHGTEDTLIPVGMGRQLFAEYRALGVDLSWREYPTVHRGAAQAGAGEAIARLASYLLRRPTTRSAPQTT